jgi:tetratricopeptide (TPR) repeat protein
MEHMNDKNQVVGTPGNRISSLLVFLIGVICVICGLDIGAATRGSAPVHTLVVFPFENLSGRSDLNWISESFPVMLSSRLVRPENYVLGRAERNAAYTQLGLPADAPLTLASEYKVAETLGVDWAVLGSFDVTGERLTARAQLLEVHKLKLSPPLEVNGELDELVDLQSRLAWRLLAACDPEFTVGREEDFVQGFPQVRLDAFENYVRGILAPDDETRATFFLASDRLNPTDHHAAFALGQLYFQKKDYASSAQWLRKLEVTDPNYLESLFLLGVDEFILGHEQSAEMAFRTLSIQIPLNEVFNNLGALKARREQYLEALADFNRGHLSDPTDADYCFNRGVSLWYLKRYNEAAESLEEAVRLNDDDAEAHTLLAVVSRKLGDSAGERRELRWLAGHEVGTAAEVPVDILPQPRLKKNYDGRAFRLLSLTLHNVLEERLAKLPPPQHRDFHLANGKKLFAEGRLPEAEREVTEAISLIPGDSDTHLLLAQVLEAEGKRQEAAAELETSLKVRDNVAARLLLARVYLTLERPELARDQGEQALKLDPSNRDAEELLRQIDSARALPKKAH